MEKQKANQIHKEANTANNKDELRIMNLFNFNESEILKSVRSCILKCEYFYLFKDSTRMEKQRATRNTELTKAPRTSALAQPNVFFDHFFGDI